MQSLYNPKELNSQNRKVFSWVVAALFGLAVVFLSLLYTGKDAYAQTKVLEGPIKATVVHVLDGDTIDITARIWLGQEVATRVRLSGIDTPEMRAKCAFEKEKAIEAKDLLSALVLDKQVILKNIRYGKYAGRVLADIELLDGTPVELSLFEASLARPYDGGKRQSWC